MGDACLGRLLLLRRATVRSCGGLTVDLLAFPWGKVPPKEADEGKGIEICCTYSEASPFSAHPFSSELVLCMSMAFPSSVTAAPCHLPPGEGKGRRSPNNHQGSALKRGNRGTPTPLQGQPHKTTETNGTDFL